MQSDWTSAARTPVAGMPARRRRMRYLGHADVPSAGWSKGRISDQVAATESIRAAVTEAERRAQVSVEGAVVGVGGASIEGMNGRGLYEFGRPREIDPAI